MNPKYQAQKGVLFLTEYYPPLIYGGGERSCQLFAQHLVRQGYSVTVLTSAARGLPRESVQQGVRVLRRLHTGAPTSARSNLKRMLQFPRSLLRETARLLADENFAFVHCFNMTTLAAVELRSQVHIPFIAHVNSLVFACPKGDLLYHGKTVCTIVCNYNVFVPCLRDSQEIGKLRNTPLISANPLALRLIYSRYRSIQELLKQFDHCIAISSFIRHRLLRLGIPPHKISVLPNIAELVHIPKRVRSDHNKTIRLLFVGTLSVAKGIPELLSALRDLPGSWQCDIIGTGPLDRLVGSVTDHRIHWHKRVMDLNPWYAQADIVLFPSRWPEPFGRVAIEAMAQGKPVIATAAGGIPDIIAPGTGVLIPPGDADALRRAVQRLMQSQKLRSALGQRAKKHVQAHFAPKPLIAALDGIYQSVQNDFTTTRAHAGRI
ncbi:MAG TPA: glycosyltransferase family 4 protein [Candidatus Nanoarchaeia archaeon]|nr:glycosyltransferase family 4 protein [Candidatus Nanoarchaeia archaeon]